MAPMSTSNPAPEGGLRAVGLNTPGTGYGIPATLRASLVADRVSYIDLPPNWVVRL